MSETISRYIYYINGEAVEEDDLPESDPQFRLTHYLVSVLDYYYRYERWYVGGNINVYRIGHYDERVAPDVLVAKIVLSPAEREVLKSWVINPPTRPSPSVVFEISSDATWSYDILPEYKPTRYRELGVTEYFAFDPSDEWADNSVQILGWRYENGVTTKIEPDEQGRLWSAELASWVVAENGMLRLYDTVGNRRLTEGEAEFQRARQQEQRAEQERTARLEAERQQQVERERAEQERSARAALEQEIVALKAKLEKEQQ